MRIVTIKHLRNEPRIQAVSTHPTKHVSYTPSPLPVRTGISVQRLATFLYREGETNSFGNFLYRVYTIAIVTKMLSATVSENKWWLL